MAGIILPSSILSNGNNTYVTARSILLQYFDIVAIAELGSGTFGKTGTNTVTLFLRRKATTPDTAEHYRERIDQWFAGDENQPVYQDDHLLDQYAAHIGVALADYQTMLAGKPGAVLLAHDTFSQYRAAFDRSTEIVNLKKQKGFKAKPDYEQSAELDKRFLTFIQTIERDKLFHFVLASQQPNPVLIIKSPTDTKAQKQFLGYEWSSAKGSEGIKLLKDDHGHHLTLMYDESDRDNPSKINRCIAENFDGRLAVVPAELSDYANMVRLVDMLDFSRVTFEKQIGLTIKNAMVVQSRWPFVKLGDVANVLIGGTPSRSKPIFFTGNNLWVSIAEMNGNIISGTKEKITDEAVRVSNVKLIPKGTTLLSFKPSIGKTAIAGIDLYTNEAIAGLIPKNRKSLADSYLFQVFNSRHIDLEGTGFKAFGKSLNSTFLKEDVKIPLPPIDVQQQIVTECEVVDAEAATAYTRINTETQNIISNIESLYRGSVQSKQLQEICTIKRGRFTHRPRNEPRFFGGPYPFIQTGDVVRAVASKITYTQTLNEDGLAVSKLFQPPIVLITIAANIGDTAVLDYPACFTDSVVGLTPQDGIDARFLELMMRAQKKHLNDIAPQMAQKNINIEILKPIRVPVPPLPVQQRLVAEVETLEKNIAEAQAIIAAAPAKKQAVMQRYL